MAKWLALIVLTISCGWWILTETSAASHGADDEPSDTVQNIVPQNLTGTYTGKVYLRDARNRRYLMLGPADLEIKGNEFTLCETIKDKKTCSGKKIIGQISFSIIPAKEDLGVGYIQLNNDKRIEIRWHRDTSCDIFKIVRARGAGREFRFCSNLDDKQCFGNLEPCQTRETTERVE